MSNARRVGKLAGSGGLDSTGGLPMGLAGGNHGVLATGTISMTSSQVALMWLMMVDGVGVE